MDDLTKANNAALLREAKSKGKSSGFRTGVLFTALAGLTAAVALNKLGVNVTDKSTELFDKTVDAAKTKFGEAKAKSKAKKATKSQE